jgi:hypothetical protein
VGADRSRTARLGGVAVDVELSRAVTVYVTTRPHGFPHQDAAAPAAEFGAESAAALKVRVDALIGEMFAATPPWLETGEPVMLEDSDIYRAVMSTVGLRHPELSPEAVAALANYYTYCNR